MTSDLPPGWVQATIGDVCRPVAKTDPRNSPDVSFEYIDIGGIQPESGRIRETKTLMGVDAPSRARQIVRAGDIVLSTVRTYQRKTAIVPDGLDGAIASTGFAVLRPYPGVDSRFVLFQALSREFVERLNAKQTGTSYPAVRGKDVRSASIRIAPSSEQERIVATIEEHFSRLDASSEALAAAQTRIEASRRAILSHAFTGQLVPQDPDDEPASALLDRISRSRHSPGRRPSHDTDPIRMTDDLPTGWAWAEFGSITDTQLGKMLSAKAKHGHQPRPYLRNQNVQWHDFDLSDVAEMDFSDTEATKYELRPGDLLVCEGGEVGRCAVWSRPQCEMYFQKALHRVRPLAGVSVRWMEHFLRWSAETGRFGAHTSGSTISHLPQRDLRRLRVPVPPKPEQERIVAAIGEHFSRLDAASEALDAAQTRIEASRRAILSHAFTGQLVPQDPDDEPATVLLDRIAASRPLNANRRRVTA